MRVTRPSFSIAFPKLLVDNSHLRRGLLAVSYGRKPEEVARKLRAACMKDEGSAHSKDATEKTGFEDYIVSRRSLTGSPRTEDRGWLAAVQWSRANANAAKSTSCASSTRRSSVVVPGLNDVVQGSTCAPSSRPRVSAWSSFSCFPDEPRKMRGLSIRSFRQRGLDGARPTRARQERHNVRYWHFADINVRAEHVCFGGKADIPKSRSNVG